jgi:hypothetical protein
VDVAGYLGRGRTEGAVSDGTGLSMVIIPSLHTTSRKEPIAKSMDGANVISETGIPGNEPIATARACHFRKLGVEGFTSERADGEVCPAQDARLRSSLAQPLGDCRGMSCRGPWDK